MNAKLVAVVITSLAILGTAGCSSKDGSKDRAPAAPAQAAAAPHVEVRVMQSGLGSILTDQNGRTLYAFTRDQGGTGACTGNCVATWPALVGQQKVAAGDGINASMLSESPRAEGTVQATYNQWPLYYYVGDVGPGDVDGQNVDGEWFVVRPDGTLLHTNS
jgi:predicted lipoprotein with Yx(FWY)xxD motif